MKKFITAFIVVIIFAALGMGIIAAAYDGDVASLPIIGQLFDSDSPSTPQSTPEALPSLQGTKIVIDAGHGGFDPGCEIGNVLEKDITLSVSLLLKEKLEDYGAEVIMTRGSDIDISLADRTKLANEAQATYFISIHCNSYEDDLTVNGFECYYSGSDSGKRLAGFITAAADSASIETRDVKTEDFHVLRESIMPAVLIEIGFLTNSQERELLLSDEYQELIATSIAKGVLSMANSGS